MVFCIRDDGENTFGPPPGAARSLETHNRQIAGMTNGRITKLDDDYMESFAKQHAQTARANQTSPQVMLTQTPLSGGRPAFGKRM